MRALVLPAVLCAAAFGGRLDAAEKPAQPPRATISVGFDGFVNWDFHHRMKLVGWKTTAQVIQRTLDLWYPRHARFSTMENGSPDAFEAFLHALPGKKDCDISIVYLASHQSPVAEWDYTQRKYLTLRRALQETDVTPHPGRIVILDACYSAAALHYPIWQQKFAPVTLFASSASEETPDVNFHHSSPVNFARRYPEAYAWLKKNLGWGWDGRISYLGFVWVQSFVTSKSPPASLDDWVHFLQRCQAVSDDYRANVSRIPSSEVTASILGRSAYSPVQQNSGD
ncbi:MAG: hypothetical protein WCD79_13735 [Chthoniobacteraceae bacterium]